MMKLRSIAHYMVRLTVLTSWCAQAAVNPGSAAAEFSDQVVVRAGEGGYHTYRIPAAIVTRTDTVVLFLEGRKGSHSDFTAIDLLALRSQDGGRTWDKPHVVSTQGTTAEQISIGNPCPVYDLETGRIWCSFNRATSSTSHSPLAIAFDGASTSQPDSRPCSSSRGEAACGVAVQGARSTWIASSGSLEME